MLAVHPRVYGEYALSYAILFDAHGSSPRVRGIRFGGFSLNHPRRFIPACTGNTVPSPVYFVLFTVHPRVYGEYSINLENILSQAGSSPRVRGILLTAVIRSTSRRFIPACTGNTVNHCLPRRPYRFIPACTGNTDPCTTPSTRTTVHPRVYGEYCFTK